MNVHPFHTNLNMFLSEVQLFNSTRWLFNRNSSTAEVTWCRKKNWYCEGMSMYWGRLGPKRWREYLYTSPSIIKVMKLLRMQWAGHVACTREMRNAHRISVGKPEHKRPIGRRRRRWEDNNKKHMGWGCGHGNETLVSPWFEPNTLYTEAFDSIMKQEFSASDRISEFLNDCRCHNPEQWSCSYLLTL